MAETQVDLKSNQSLSKPLPGESLSFIEVTCKASGKCRRFSVGTEAGFAVDLINKKLRSEGGRASHIEAINEEEEAISFGPSSLLVNYGPGWKLQTVIDPQEQGFLGVPYSRKGRSSPAYDKVSADSKATQKNAQLGGSVLYVWRIMLAFLLIFVFGAFFTLLLENLPWFIQQAKRRALESSRVSQQLWSLARAAA